MKKFILLLLALVMAIGTFAGCGGNNDSSSEENVEVKIDTDFDDDFYNQTTTLSVAYRDLADRDYIKALEVGFKEMYPNVTVNPVQISGDYVAMVSSAVRRGKFQDLFFTSETELPIFMSNGALMNLKPYIEAEKVAHPGWIDEFIDTALSIGQENYNGDQYFIPRSSDRIVTHLNMKYIKSLPEETQALVKNGWTWDDFLTVAKAIRKQLNDDGNTASGKGRYVLDASFSWGPVMLSLFKSNEASIYENGEWTLNNEGTKKTLQMINELVDEEIIPVGAQDKADYAMGYGAMFFHSSSAIMNKKKELDATDDPKDEYNCVTFPIINGEKGVIGYGVPGYGIYKGSPNRDLAWQFLKFMMSKDGQNILGKAGVKTPSIRKDLQDAEDAEWRKGLEGVNLEAATWEPQRNYSETFFWNFPPSTRASLSGDIGTLISRATARPNGNTPNFDDCIQDAIKNLKAHSVVK